MSYLGILRPDIRIGIVDVNTSGVSISLASPKIALSSITWKTSQSGTATVSNNNISLTANKKYLLQATLSFNERVDYSDDRLFRWYNESSSSWLGKPGICDSEYEAYNSLATFRIDEAARCVIIPATATNISLKYSGSTNQTVTVGDKPTTDPWDYITDYSRIEIWEISN